MEQYNNATLYFVLFDHAGNVVVDVARIVFDAKTHA